MAKRKSWLKRIEEMAKKMETGEAFESCLTDKEAAELKEDLLRKLDEAEFSARVKETRNKPPKREWLM